jgi:type II secretion system protein N
VSAAARGARARRRRTGAGGGTLLVALGCLLLTALFFVLRFPVDRFRGALVAQLAAVTGADATVGALAARPGLGGLTLVAAPVSARWPGGARLELERAALRPAWSLSWLRGRPALHLDLRAPVGALSGTLWPGDPAAFDGELEGVALEQLPPELLALAEGIALTGRLDAEVGLEQRAGRLVGELELALADGSFSAPGAPVAVPFESLDAEIRLAESGAVEVGSARLDGPMLSGEARGQIGAAASVDLAPLAFEADLEVVDPTLRSWLAPLGVAVDPSGRAKLRIGGTLAEPTVR